MLGEVVQILQDSSNYSNYLTCFFLVLSLLLILVVPWTKYAVLLVVHGKLLSNHANLPDGETELYKINLVSNEALLIANTWLLSRKFPKLQPIFLILGFIVVYWHLHQFEHDLQSII
jgi:hypothetical protein